MLIVIYLENVFELLEELLLCWHKPGIREGCETELTFRVPYHPVPPLAKHVDTSRSALFHPSMNALVLHKIPVRLAGIRQ